MFDEKVTKKEYKTGIVIILVFLLSFFMFGVEIQAEDAHYAYLTGKVEQGKHKEFDDAIHSVPYKGTLTVYINTPGGAVSQLMEWVEFFDVRKDIELICIVSDGDIAYSAGAYFLIMCDKQIVHEDARIMFHLPYFIVEDKEGNLIKVSDPGLSYELYSYYAQNHRLREILTINNLLEHYLVGYDIFYSGKQYNKTLTQLK